MAKKPNTLKDLNAFLDHQKAKEEEAKRKKAEAFMKKPPAQLSSVAKGTIHFEKSEDILPILEELYQKEGNIFLDSLSAFLLQKIRSKKELTEGDILLVNALLLKKHPENWEVEVEAFWKSI